MKPEDEKAREAVKAMAEEQKRQFAVMDEAIKMGRLSEVWEEKDRRLSKMEEATKATTRRGPGRPPKSTDFEDMERRLLAEMRDSVHESRRENARLKGQLLESQKYAEAMSDKLRETQDAYSRLADESRAADEKATAKPSKPAQRENLPPGAEALLEEIEKTQGGLHRFIEEVHGRIREERKDHEKQREELSQKVHDVEQLVLLLFQQRLEESQVRTELLVKQMEAFHGKKLEQLRDHPRRLSLWP